MKTNFLVYLIAAALLMSISSSACRINIVKYNDLNGNGNKDSDEPKLQNFTFTVIGIDVSFNKTVVTGIDGTVTVNLSSGGKYRVTEMVPAGWIPTSTNPRNVTVPSGGEVTVKFGNMLITTTTTSTTQATTTTTESTTTTTEQTTTTTVPNAPEFASISLLAAILLATPAFAYLAVKKKE